MYFIGYQGNIWELPCGSLCPVSGTPSPISLPAPTPSPVVLATPAPTPSPVTPDTPAPTPSPVQSNTPSPTISPTITEAPVLEPGDDDEDDDDNDPCNPDEDELVEMQPSPTEVFPEYKGCWNDRDEFADDRTFRLAYYWSDDMTVLVSKCARFHQTRKSMSRFLSLFIVSGIAIRRMSRNLPMVLQEMGDLLSDLEGLMAFRIFP